MPHDGFRTLVQDRLKALFLSKSQAHVRADRDLTGLNRMQGLLCFSPVVQINDCSEPSDDLPFEIAQWYGVRNAPTVTVWRPPKAKLALKCFTARN